jgi:hypothetical protein
MEAIPVGGYREEIQGSHAMKLTLRNCAKSATGKFSTMACDPDSLELPRWNFKFNRTC